MVGHAVAGPGPRLTRRPGRRSGTVGPWCNHGRRRHHDGRGGHRQAQRRPASERPVAGRSEPRIAPPWSGASGCQEGTLVEPDFPSGAETYEGTSL